MHSVVYDYQTFSLQQYGGISRYFCEIAPRVHRAQGFEVRIVAPVHFNAYLARCDVPKTAHYMRKLWKTGPLFRAVNRAVSPRLMQRHKPSLVHRTFFEPLDWPSGVPVIVTVHDMINELFPGSFVTTDVTASNKRLCVERADHIVCNSHFTANDLIRLTGISRKKVSVTHLGYSDVFTATAPLDEKPPHPRPYLLYVGHRAGHKNFDAAIAAFAASQRLCGDLDFVAFGGLPFSNAERGRMAALRLAPNRVLRWSGSDSELARAYRGARALVYPSTYEGFGIPPLEAMSAGCAVVCSNTSSIPEVVGEAALMFNPDDIESIRQAMEAVCLDDSTRSALIAAGKTRVRQFSWDKCAADTQAVYESLL